MSTTKVQSQVGIQLQTTAAFESNALVTLPYTKYGFIQKRNTINDDSYQGVAFTDTPQKGVNDTSGTIGMNVDIVSLSAYLAGITGWRNYPLAYTVINATEVTQPTPLADAIYLVPVAGWSSSHANAIAIYDHDTTTWSFVETTAINQGTIIYNTATSAYLVLVSSTWESALSYLATGHHFYFNPSIVNTKKYSVARKDGVSYKQYANVYAKSLKLLGSVDSLISAELDLIGVTPEVRAALSGWPASTGPGEAFSFHEMSGSGYFRVGDQADALAAGDNLRIEDFSFDIVTGYDAQHYNSYSILTPQYGQVRPDVQGSFKISEHDVDTFIAFRDNMTKLQLKTCIYKTSTAQIIITIPNFIIDVELSDDDLVRQGVTMKIGRNGIGTSYVNTNITNVSPIIFQIINS